MENADWKYVIDIPMWMSAQEEFMNLHCVFRMWYNFRQCFYSNCSVSIGHTPLTFRQIHFVPVKRGRLHFFVQSAAHNIVCVYVCGKRKCSSIMPWCVFLCVCVCNAMWSERGGGWSDMRIFQLGLLLFYRIPLSWLDDTCTHLHSIHRFAFTLGERIPGVDFLFAKCF